MNLLPGKDTHRNFVEKEARPIEGQVLSQLVPLRYHMLPWPQVWLCMQYVLGGPALVSHFLSGGPVVSFKGIDSVNRVYCVILFGTISSDRYIKLKLVSVCIT